MATSAIDVIEGVLTAQVPELMALRDSRGRAGQVFVHVKEAPDQPLTPHWLEMTECSAVVARRMLNVFIIFLGSTPAQVREAEVAAEALLPRIERILRNKSLTPELRSVAPLQPNPPQRTQFDFDDDAGDDALVAVLPVRVEYVTEA